MPYEPKLIAPFQTGLQTDVKPWLAPEDAFAELNNAFVFRGRVKKKPGFIYSGEDVYESRLKIKVGKTDAVSGFHTTSLSAYDLAPGQIFRIEEEVFTIPKFSSSDQSITLLISGDATRGVIDLSNKQLSLTTSHLNKDVYYFPALPVMGITMKELEAINANEPVVFDTHYSYTFKKGIGWTRSDDKKFAGDSTSYFSATNFYGDSVDQTFFYAVNGKAANGISYLKENSTKWETFKPLIKLEEKTSDEYLYSSKIIKSFANRLFCLNTLEGKADPKTVKNYPYRIRWGPIGGRATGDIANAPEWDSTAALGAGWLEIPTREAITAVEFLRDRMIVFCESSIWMVVLIGSAVKKKDAKTGQEDKYPIPFALKQVNSEFGAESINGTVFFDNSLLVMTNKGIIQTDTINVKRIDTRIPEEFEKINRKSEGFKKVWAFRDTLNQLVYWGFPHDSEFCNKTFCWNYALDSWAIFDFSLTAMGKSIEFNPLTWTRIGQLYPSWSVWETPWGSNTLKSQDTKVMVGNQQGFLFYMDNSKPMHPKELSITNINPSNQEIEVQNHNLKNGDWVEIEIDHFANVGKMVYQVNRINDHTIKLEDFVFTGSYLGKGYLTRAPRIDILTKEWTFGFQTAKQFYFPYADFLLSDEPGGEISVTLLINTAAELQFNEKALLGSNKIAMKPDGGLGRNFPQEIRWHRLFLESRQAGVQFRIWLTDEQMKDKSKANASFDLHAFLFYISVEERLTT